MPAEDIILAEKITQATGAAFIKAYLKYRHITFHGKCRSISRSALEIINNFGWFADTTYGGEHCQRVAVSGVYAAMNRAVLR